MSDGQGEVVLVVDGLSDPVHVSVESVERLLATTPLPGMLVDLSKRLKSTIAQTGASVSGPVNVNALERDVLRSVIYKAKYQQRKGMPLDLADLEERLRPSRP
jgi:hypothetical protein